MDEPLFKDTDVAFRYFFVLFAVWIKSIIWCHGRSGRIKASGFVLSLLSPVWESKLCRFSSGPKKIQSLEGEEKETFNSVISLACGKDVTVSGLAALLDLGRLAEKYCISDVSNAVQLAALNTTNCAELLIASEATRLSALSKASSDLALEQFSKVSETDCFLHLDKTTLAALLKDNGLMGREEPVYRVHVGIQVWLSSQCNFLPLFASSHCILSLNQANLACT